MGATVLVLALLGALATLARIGRFTFAAARGIGRWYSHRSFSRERRRVQSKEQLLALALQSMRTIAEELEDARNELRAMRAKGGRS